MKIAVCLYGQPRSIEKGLEYSKKFYSDLSVDFYIHSWGDEKVSNELNTFFNPRKIIVEPQKTDFENLNEYTIDPAFNSKDLISTISPLYSIYKVGELLENDTEEYEYVVFTRTDIAMIGNTLKNYLNSNQVIYSSYVNGTIWEIKPNNDNHVDIKMICSNKNAMVYFSKLYKNLYKYHKEDKVMLCHHRMIYHHLKKLNLPFKMIKLNDSMNNGGWFFIRGENLSET